MIEKLKVFLKTKYLLLVFFDGKYTVLKTTNPLHEANNNDKYASKIVECEQIRIWEYYQCRWCLQNFKQFSEKIMPV